MEELRFDGRVAVITGAGRGIGREYALLLADRGAKVVVNDLGVETDGTGTSGGPAQSVVDEIVAGGGDAIADVNSVATREGSEAVVRTAVDAYGQVDVLIHNAGFVNGSFEALIAVGLGGSYWLTEAAWPHMSERGYGRILLTTSGAGLYGAAGGPDYSPMQSYGAVKVGVFGLAKCLAVRGRFSNIHVNLIAPCAGTRLQRELPPTPEMQWVSTRARPELVAPAAAYLVHEACTLSGEALSVGAGRVARIFVGETTGYVNDDLTLEDVAAHMDEIFDESGYHVPADMGELVDMFMKIVG